MEYFIGIIIGAMVTASGVVISSFIYDRRHPRTFSSRFAPDNRSSAWSWYWRRRGY